MKTYSLRLRLGGLLLLLTLLTWGVASMFAWMQTTKSIRRTFYNPHRRAMEAG